MSDILSSILVTTEISVSKSNSRRRIFANSIGIGATQAWQFNEISLVPNIATNIGSCSELIVIKSDLPINITITVGITTITYTNSTVLLLNSAIAAIVLTNLGAVNAKISWCKV